MSKTSIIGTSALKDKLQEYATKVGRISARPLLLRNHPKYADLLIAKKLASVYSRVFL